METGAWATAGFGLPFTSVTAWWFKLYFSLLPPCVKYFPTSSLLLLTSWFSNGKSEAGPLGSSGCYITHGMDATASSDLSWSPQQDRQTLFEGPLSWGMWCCSEGLPWCFCFISSERTSSSDLRYAVPLAEPNKSRIQLTLTFMAFCT